MRWCYCGDDVGENIVSFGLSGNGGLTKIELGEINAQKVTYGSELYLKKRRKNMVDKLEPLGLKEANEEPPKKIVVE